MSPSKKANSSKADKVEGAKAGGGVTGKGKEEGTREIQELVSEPSKPGGSLRPAILRILAVLAVVGITVYVYSVRDHVEEFAQWGYLGAFLIMLIANATVILPAPGVAVIFAMGGILNPLGVALAAGVGGTLGELTGYLAGYGGQAAVENTQVYNRVLPWVQKYGAWVILVMSAIPNPFFDIAGIAAGITRIPIWKFLLACWVGQTIKMTMFAFAGAYSIDWIASFYD